MITVKVRRTRDVDYLNHDSARELDGVRDGPALRWLRGAGDLDHEEDVARVLTSTSRSSVVGYDLIIAAPRPASIVVAVDETHARAVVAAHRDAVSQAIDYLEDRALVVRDRRGGEERDLAGHWSHVAAFTHGVNRHGEPHLHDHVLVGARPSDARNVLDSRALFAHVLAADALYRSTLRSAVAATTPYTPWRSFEGVEHVAQLDEGYRVLWGGHHSERGDKRHWSREETRAAWAADLARFESHGSVPVAPRRADRLDEHAFSSSFEGRLEVSRRHVVAAWANAATFGARARDVEAAVDLLYPSLRASRGVHEPSLGVPAARMIAVTRENGPRPLELTQLDHWRQRSRDRSRDDVGRSRY